MPHLSSFKVQRYRGLRDLSVSNLAPMNLFTGQNGVGKSSVLEALYLFLNRARAADWWSVVHQRAQEPVTNPLARLTNGEVSMQGVEGGAEHTLTARYETKPCPGQPTSLSPALDPDSGGAGELAALLRQGVPIAGVLHVSLDGKPPDLTGWIHRPKGIVLAPPGSSGSLPATFVAAVAPAPMKEESIPDFSWIIQQGQKEELREDLRHVFPVVEDVEIVTRESQSPSVLATTVDGKRLPLESLGTGMRRLFILLLAMRMTRGGVILIDEINSEFHHSVLEDLWRRIRTLASRLEVQLFATTHSLECVDAAIAAFEDSPDDLAVHNLRSRSHESPVRAVTFRGESLQGAREINLEVR